MFGTEFRPLVFNQVFGLTTVKRILSGYLRSGDLDRGYLFSGSYSSGKTTLGRIFARSILCKNRQEDGSPCNECDSCRDFLNGRHNGYLEIDAANNGSKDRIHEIIEMLKYESISSKKIILFDEAHNISKEGTDALLLKLEENDPNIILLFCTTEFDKMPSTIVSRCTKLKVSEPTERDLLKKLEYICTIKNLEYDKQALYIIAQAVGPHYRDAENILKQISMLGSINEDNVKSVVSLYDREIADMLLSLPNNLSKAINISSNILQYMDTKQIYTSILRLINDAIKSLNGYTFESSQYSAIVGDLKDNFGVVLYEFLDFILNKNKLNDKIAFQSDILILHYKFIKGGFKFKAFESVSTVDQMPKKKQDDSDFERSILEDKSLQPWEKDDKLRELRMKKIKPNKENLVNETISSAWGPEAVPQTPRKTKLSREQFNEIIGGSDESNTI